MADKNEDKPRFPRLIICEGPEDCLFFERLIEERGLPRFHIWPSGGRGRSARGGIDKFASALRAFEVTRTKTYQSLRDIVIVADNDETPKENFGNICRQIEEVFGQGTAPTKPLERTTKIKPAITVLMIPWTDKNGHLEALCCPSAMDADRSVSACVDHFLATVGAERWKNESRHAKAWLRSSLAARCSDPFVPLGRVFDEPKHRSLIPVTHKSLNNIVDFLYKLGTPT